MTLKPDELHGALLKARGHFPEAKLQAGLILETGRPEAAAGWECIACSEIPGFPESFGEASLLLGSWGGAACGLLENGPQLHQGVTALEAAFPVWFFHQLGASRLILTTAAGSLHPRMGPGSLMAVTDHLNFLGTNPLVGLEEERLGPRFPDLAHTYDREETAALIRLGRKQKLTIKKGILAATLGPGLETTAEKTFLRKAGADAMTNSLIPQAIAGKHAGLKILALAAITDQALEGKKTLSIEDMLAAAARTAPRMEHLLETYLGEALT